ncbi:hypothetical protein L6E12_24885 [Actinokineospora sp. PR83]|uniref:hypothetical protein n=1 Tax=Actinokineospora sp. PR83 TaxID=2884908 RepID=UPI001F42DB2D|nr:hypothetical protein [Actinokineospora sp. PR83]MCG8919022.1 hypothetical protein [Actinokineospora sp. PR83]
MDPGELLDGMETGLAQVVRTAEAVRNEMAAVTVHLSEAGISLTVNHMGNLIALDLTNTAREDPALGKRILRLVQEAQAKLPDAMRAGVPSARGTQTLDAIVSQTRAMFPEPAADEYVPGGARTRTADEPDDDYYSRGGLFR